MKGHDLNPAGILLLLREGRADDVESIKATVDGPIPYLEPMLANLKQADLIDADLQPSVGCAGAKIRLGARFGQVQHVLGFSLRALSMSTADTLSIQPYFGRPLSLLDRVDVFVLMPFAPDLADVYRDHITKVASDLGLVAKRADDFFSSHHVMSDIWRAIWFSQVIVADCTTRNPNVFYEIGLAHTIGKPVILITQNDDDVPFDLRAVRYIKYEFKPRGMEVFKTRLRSTIQNVLREQRSTFSPADAAAEPKSSYPPR